jgi:nucleoside-diphosphate-sugar epimerase
MTKRVLLTGPAGNVGEEALAELLRRRERYEIRAFDLPNRRVRRRLRPFRGEIDVVFGDLRNRDDVARAVEGVDAVVHLAAVIPPQADREHEEARSTNVDGTRNLLDALEEQGRSVPFIHASSISLYGDRLAEPWIGVGDAVKPNPHDCYAETKLEGEKLVQASTMAWSIFRLTGVMSMRVGLDPLMFHMPLATSFEIVTARDCGYAFVQALEVEKLAGRIFNLAGGPRCRTTFADYLDRHLSIMGFGAGFLPPEAFAEGNFHCGFYRDSDELQELLGFQRDGLDEWFQHVRDHTHPAIPVLARASRPLARLFLLSLSEPLAARKRGDREELRRFAIGDTSSR